MNEKGKKAGAGGEGIVPVLNLCQRVVALPFFANAVLDAVIHQKKGSVPHIHIFRRIFSIT